MTQPIGAVLTPLIGADELVRELLVRQALPLALDFGSATHAALQCADTFVWGVFDAAAAQWFWSSDEDPALRPPRAEMLLEARVFGLAAEVLLWRDGGLDQQSFCGRLAHQPDPAPDGPSAPLDRIATFTGAVKSCGARFVTRTTPGGKVTVTPPGRGIRVCEYLTACPDTGVLRIAMTRFLEII